MTTSNNKNENRRRSHMHDVEHRHSHKKNRRSGKKTPFNLKLWTKSTWEIMTTSLFFSPVLAVIFAVLLGVALSYFDTFLSLQGDSIDPPVIWTTTIASARTLLSTVAGATISFAGTAFSVSLLVIQLASSQYSPRIVHTLFKDPFNRRIVALVVGTFTYCLVVIRSLGDTDNRIGSDGNVDEQQAQVIPNVSVAVAFLLGIASVLAIVAFIDHAANTMDISQLLERVTRDTLLQIQRTWDEEDVPPNDAMADTSDTARDNPTKPESRKGEEAQAEKSTSSHVVRFRSSGWVQEIDTDLLLRLIPKNGCIKLHTLEGRYAIPGSAVCSVYPKPTKKNWTGKNLDDDVAFVEDLDGEENSDEDENARALEIFEDRVLDAIMIGLSRTMRSDATYGLRQLVDVVLRALSPGVNDPTTAQDGIFHVAAVVTEFLHRRPPKSVMESTETKGRLILYEQHDYDSIVRLGFDEARVCAVNSPTVALYLLESLRLIRESLQSGGHPHRAPEIERQAKLTEEGICNNKAHVGDDHELIVRARRDRFDSLYHPASPEKSRIMFA